MRQRGEAEKAGADGEEAPGRRRRTVGPATAAMGICLPLRYLTAARHEVGEETTDGRAPRPLGRCGGRQTRLPDESKL
jgi:hypothetical protein